MTAVLPLMNFRRTLAFFYSIGALLISLATSNGEDTNALGTSRLKA